LLIKISQDIERAKSILNSVSRSEEMLEQLDLPKFASNIVKEYYEIIRELISVVLLLDGYKVVGESAHKELIEFFCSRYEQFSGVESVLIDDLRKVRNKIAYEGFSVGLDFLRMRQKYIKSFIRDIKALISVKIGL
jgi:hypothetical protein